MSLELKKKKPPSSLAGLPPVTEPPLAGLQPIRFGREICSDLKEAHSREWVVTNGLGGYASSTLLGMNTRRSHGLLVAALTPPARRMVLLSKVEETLVVPGGRFELSTNRYAAVVHPEGYRYLEEFRLDPCPTFFWRVGETLLEKSVFMLPGENATVVGYVLHAASSPIELVIQPLAALRALGDLRRESSDFQPKVEQSDGLITLRLPGAAPALALHHTAEMVEEAPCWYRGFEYTADGVPEREDLWSFGVLRYLLKVGEACLLVASTGRRGIGDYAFHRRRLENSQTVLAQNLEPPGSGPLALRLAWTADHFSAWRPGGVEAFLLAGFPDGVPGGRDALLALPGLAIVPRRFDLARAVLLTLAGGMKEGLLPVRWSEAGGEPEYDSADTSLWFFCAVWQFWRASRDLRFVARKLLDPLREILQSYLEGAPFGIGMDDDGLIRLSDRSSALTWMNFPRWGKPVEVNALWYCALVVMSRLAERLGLRQAARTARLSRLVGQNFVRAFYSRQGLLFDRVTDEGPDASVRANMLVTLGLPFCPLSRAQGLRVLATAEEHLLTPMGVRTLSPRDPGYRGRCDGTDRDRALAIHRGTIWTGLTGSYVSAVCRLRGLTRATQASLARQMKPILPHLEQGCLGSVGELFDGDPPHEARGGVSQAWAAGELLRAIREARLGGL